MRWVRGSFLVAAVAAVVTLQWANWTAQRQTQGKLDALLAREAPRTAEPVLPSPMPPVPAPYPAPAPTVTVVATPASRVVPAAGTAPLTLGKVSPPPYVIEAPDVLQIEVVVKDPKTGASAGLPTQNVSGQFIVRPDGTVGFGLWGSVRVDGSTVEQAQQAIREYLVSQKRGVSADGLQVHVEVVASNSKRYYVITDAIVGEEQVYVFPATGSETVLDAVGQLGGLAKAAESRKVWVARRSAAGGPWLQLPVDWNALTQQSATSMNYQIMPGDRLYVKCASD